MERHVFCAVSDGPGSVVTEETFLPESVGERDIRYAFSRNAFHSIARTISSTICSTGITIGTRCAMPGPFTTASG